MVSSSPLMTGWKFRDFKILSMSAVGYELPNIEEHLNKKEITQYCKEIGLMPIHIKKLPAAKHIFSHIEWQMIGYDIRVDELEKTNNKKYLFIHPEEIQKEYPIPSAFEKYMKLI